MPVSDDSLKNKEDFLYLWLVVYREARGEPMEAQVAVAHTLVTRASKPRWWGKTVAECAVKPWQYSSMTDPKDPQLPKSWPTLSTPDGLATARVADEVLRGALANPMPGATHYHDDSIAPPKWTIGARFCGKVGKLNFYETT